MSKYTIEVRTICEQLAQTSDITTFENVEDIIEKSAPLIFNFDFPLFDEEYRKPLTEHILLHFYRREIGQETYGAWRLALMQTLHDVMPEINELYKSIAFKFDPMHDIDYTTDTTSDATNQATRSTSATEKSTRKEQSNIEENGTSKEQTKEAREQLYSDTPQGRLDNVKEGNYLTSATVNSGENAATTENNNTSEQTASVAGNNERNGEENESGAQSRHLISRVFGKSSFRSYGRLLQEFRENILNVDLILFEKLEPCFMMLY